MAAFLAFIRGAWQFILLLPQLYSMIKDAIAAYRTHQKNQKELENEKIRKEVENAKTPEELQKAADDLAARLGNH